ncbi:MAG: hypothetical protein IJC32_04420 [Clostridia bacterium]|nr:hypothetical protein [Clostridia bacterium]
MRVENRVGKVTMKTAMKNIAFQQEGVAGEKNTAVQGVTGFIAKNCEFSQNRRRGFLKFLFQKLAKNLP